MKGYVWCYKAFLELKYTPVYEAKNSLYGFRKSLEILLNESMLLSLGVHPIYTSGSGPNNKVTYLEWRSRKVKHGNEDY